ncbi:MAG: 23S rRNA (pseudouridine(1915)-N(3))-methyltransferase RlmH [Rhodobacter sp.]|nr:23S rRNA (pseudouridine(1915)-N(3))-methyltransferase RlmH [Rhodobacter sp.]MCA3513683.1 23S rRNA (pseudouridine(1915)-N(3))-methyltransferase RlmH [Rhodobacter sp.]MCA3520454.1 23S rRNA (pseudouridine(1915)-N(3))-methyltransferase RlmH [Rhodobacter sp.]MCA3526062.1 23S rRNA (pseudouridine(1915)-N(3))-methyltransferase RlmH [Rhodobacter sp.]MCA3529718.1 23S rRNA (pseudouridine(1915)-N(3))-methyltransferase RlmH [Rhodobacter sp.]
MRLHLCAVGRLRTGPERILADDYMQRFNRTARPLGLGPLTEHEVEDRKGGGIAAEADLLARAVPAGAVVVALDERGQMLSSPELALRMAEWRDSGRQDLAFVIGGADGLAPALRDRADLALSFGRMVWPHMLVRVMLAEQIYRSAAILSGSPYHRA